MRRGPHFFNTLASLVLLLGMLLTSAAYPRQDSSGRPKPGKGPGGETKTSGDDSKPGRGLKARPHDEIKQWPEGSKRYALIIGVDRYSPPFTRLEGAANDARLLADALKKYAGFAEENIFLLLSDQPPDRQPTRTNIVTYLTTILRSSVPPDGLLLVAFAGHGITQGRKAYLLPTDVRGDDIKLLERTAIPVAEMKDWIEETGAGQLVVILDMCRNDPIAGRAASDDLLTGRYVRGFDFLERNRKIKGFVTLFAADIGQRAFEFTDDKTNKVHGYFTFALVEALSGAEGRTLNEDGEVTLRKVVDYLRETVPERTRRRFGKEQMPYRDVQGYADDLVIAKVDPPPPPLAAAKAAEEAPLAAANPASAAPVRATPNTPTALEWTDWEMIKKSDDLVLFEGYLKNHPEGPLSKLAARRVQSAVAPFFFAAQEQKIRIEPHTKKVINKEPKGPLLAARKNRGKLGVLFVLTDPPAAEVIVSPPRAKPQKGVAKDGEFRIELIPGTYSIEVTSGAHLPRSGTVRVTRGKHVTVELALTPTKGTILIRPVEPDAVVLVDGQKPPGATIRKGTQSIEVSDIAAGYHAVGITHPSIADWELKDVEVEGGGTTFIAPKLSPVIIDLIAKSDPGSDIYLDGLYKGIVGDTGSLLIPKVQVGKHTVTALKAEHEVAEQTKVFVPQDRVVELPLTRTLFSPDFDDRFMEALRYWDAPKSWQPGYDRVQVRGVGVGLLRNKFYKDFKMEFDVKLDNRKGVVWVVRAKDAQNYYMFQLSGPKAKTANLIKEYICTGGQRILKYSRPVGHDLRRYDQAKFHITVEVRGSSVTHTIQPTGGLSAPQIRLHSTLPAELPPYGTIGFGTIDGEEAYIYFVKVTSLDRSHRVEAR